MADPLAPKSLQAENRQRLLSDILRNAAGLPEAALTLGTGLVNQAGAGLGTLAGMAGSRLRGEPVDLDAASETALQPDFTFMPRSTGGQEVLRGIGTLTEPIDEGMQYVGQKAADVTGSPAVGAGVYTALNVLDPELAAPAVAKVAALRGAQNVARSGASAPVPSRFGQSGAWAMSDIAEAPGNFAFRSPALDAFDRLKPQEQGRVTGRQLGKALIREGAKKEELEWMGLDPIINSDDLVSTADVRRIAEFNKPGISFRSLRSAQEETGATEDDILEKARSLAWEDPDLQYPVVIYQNRGRNREVLETVDEEYEAERWIDRERISFVENNFESETAQLLDNIEEYFSEEEIAEMSDAEKKQWAENTARLNLENLAAELDYTFETDYGADPVNLESLTDYWVNRVTDDPEGYGLSVQPDDAPAYGEHTVGRRGSDPESNYTVSAGRLVTEERFGRGNADAPSFLRPYMEGDKRGPDVDSPQRDLLLNAPKNESRAFQIEALRRKARDEDPDVEKYRAPVDETHYDDLGSNQLFFTRETDQSAPSWGSVRSGVGTVPYSNLRLANGKALPRTVRSDMPMRLVEEAQSDWLQLGRKTGWADPKGLEKLRKEDAATADLFSAENARRESMQRQAISELPLALEDERLSGFIERAKAEVAQHGQDARPELFQLTQILREFQDAVVENPRDYTLDWQRNVSRRLFLKIYNASPAGSPAEDFSNQILTGLQQLPELVLTSRRKKPLPSAPMRETRQYTQLALADALRRAVQEGQQYIAWTPGDVHTKRWGTDTFQYAVDPSNPRLVRWSTTDVSRQRRGSGMENLQAAAEALFDNHSSNTLDLDDPELDKRLTGIVEQSLNYGMHSYSRPDVARRKRVELIRKELEAASKAAQAGERKAGHYSPRAMGYELAYEPMAQDMVNILRRAGVKDLPEIRDIENPYSKVPLRGFEISPEVARAAKRGLVLPY
jgi:hypothetical protein